MCHFPLGSVLISKKCVVINDKLFLKQALGQTGLMDVACECVCGCVHTLVVSRPL